MPEDEPGPHRLLDGEEVELLSQHPMVALAGLLQSVEVGVQVLPLEPGGAVDPLQHLPLLVSPPIGPCRMQQLEVLEPAGPRDVRPAAEIHEGAVGVYRDGLIVAQLVDPLQLQRIVGETAPGLGPIDHLADEGEIPGGHLGHLGFQPFQVLGGERPVHLEVVVEPVLDRRARSRSPHWGTARARRWQGCGPRNAAAARAPRGPDRSGSRSTRPTPAAGRDPRSRRSPAPPAPPAPGRDRYLRRSGGR